MSKTIAIMAGVAMVAMVGGTIAAIQWHGGSGPCGVARVDAAIGGPFELISETGETVTDADVITEPALIYFGYTFCPDVCPLDSARNAAAVDILAEQGVSVTPVFITIDPARDTVDVVKDYTDSFHPRMIGLTGSSAQVAAAAGAYQAYYDRADDDPEYYLMHHSTLTYLVMPQNGVVGFFKRPASADEVAQRTACIVQTS